MKAERIIQKFIELINEGHVIKLEQDLGGNTLTIHIDELYTHVGIMEDNDKAFRVLLDNLYDALTGGSGLSWG